MALDQRFRYYFGYTRDSRSGRHGNLIKNINRYVKYNRNTSKVENFFTGSACIYWQTG